MQGEARGRSGGNRVVFLSRSLSHLRERQGRPGVAAGDSRHPESLCRTAKMSSTAVGQLQLLDLSTLLNCCLQWRGAHSMALQ